MKELPVSTLGDDDSHPNYNLDIPSPVLSCLNHEISSLIDNLMQILEIAKERINKNPNEALESVMSEVRESTGESFNVSENVPAEETGEIVPERHPTKRKKSKKTDLLTELKIENVSNVEETVSEVKSSRNDGDVIPNAFSLETQEECQPPPKKLRKSRRTSPEHITKQDSDHGSVEDPLTNGQDQPGPSTKDTFSWLKLFESDSSPENSDCEDKESEASQSDFLPVVEKTLYSAKLLNLHPSTSYHEVCLLLRDIGLGNPLDIMLVNKIHNIVSIVTYSDKEQFEKLVSYNSLLVHKGRNILIRAMKVPEEH